MGFIDRVNTILNRHELSLHCIYEQREIRSAHMTSHILEGHNNRRVYISNTVLMMTLARHVKINQLDFSRICLSMTFYPDVCRCCNLMRFYDWREYVMSVLGTTKHS